MSGHTDDWVAQLDQAARAMVDVARVARSYYVALVDEGFTPDEAVRLTVAMTTSIMAGSRDES